MITLILNFQRVDGVEVGRALTVELTPAGTAPSEWEGVEHFANSFNGPQPDVRAAILDAIRSKTKDGKLPSDR